MCRQEKKRTTIYSPTTKITGNLASRSGVRSISFLSTGACRKKNKNRHKFMITETKIIIKLGKIVNLTLLP